jgi:hypothetical protein
VSGTSRTNVHANQCYKEQRQAANVSSWGETSNGYQQQAQKYWDDIAGGTRLLRFGRDAQDQQFLLPKIALIACGVVILGTGIPAIVAFNRIPHCEVNSGSSAAD